MAPSTYDPAVYFSSSVESQVYPISKINLIGDPGQPDFELATGSAIPGLKNIVIQFTTLFNKYLIHVSDAKHPWYTMLNGDNYVDSSGNTISGGSVQRNLYMANLQINGGKNLSEDFLIQIWTEGSQNQIVSCQINAPFGANKTLCRNLGVNFNYSMQLTPGSSYPSKQVKAANQYGILCPLDF